MNRIPGNHLLYYVDAKRTKASFCKQNPVSLRNFPTAKERREYLSKKLDIDLSILQSDSIENDQNVHCENVIGATQIPLGVAGPLRILDDGKIRDVYIPMATTEGALVASTSRGSKAIFLSGGAKVYSKLHGQTRGPVFSTKSVSKGIELKEWIENNVKKLAAASSKTSSHIKYLSAKVKVIGANTYVRFSFDTKDAMGMNMVTIATEVLVGLIEKETGAKCISVAGNFDIDKKSAWLNVIDGRGQEAWAESVIKAQVLRDILHTDAEALYSTWLAKCMVGSYASGSLGFNAHFANMISAVFIATGQDPAHVVEGSCGITTCEVRGGDLYISVNIPSLLVGTVGGGTVLPTQKAALRLMGVNGNSRSDDLARSIIGAVLAGELSLLASLSTKTLGEAHQKLGRRKKA
ncbi:MAG: hydroxymethylglutaryl-CoA reductase [Candidatus Levybacteria bacterium]|nr:hydroxymethylglutaryl-CoA reductase [Candidatus Levybacteria bacterium]